jgi:outer membrane protein TolC
MFPSTATRAAALALALSMTGCASTRVDENLASIREITDSQLGAQVEWLTTDDSRRQAETDVDALLAKPLGADDAVRITLAYSPAVQVMLSEGAARSAGLTQATRLPNPLFGFERMLRSEPGVRELEITRTLAVSLYDLILLPTRLEIGTLRQQQTALELANDVVKGAVASRQAWVQAVAAEQALGYARQVKASADASAELARRMHAVGNFSKLQRAREQAFAAEAVAQLARADQRARVARERLVRNLGLNDAQALRLVLPERLPELPVEPRDERSVMQGAIDQRLDVRIARANLAATAREQGLTRVTGAVDSFKIARVHKSDTGRDAQRGYELEVPLPVFDIGDAARLRAESTYLAALGRTAQRVVEASSHVREAYVEYRTAYDVARHYRDEVVPLRKAISEENLLRYNGMLIGVFELLADAREQIVSVIQAIDAQREFWLADAALQAALIGEPIAASPTGIEATSAADRRGH